MCVEICGKCIDNSGGLSFFDEEWGKFFENSVFDIWYIGTISNSFRTNSLEETFM